MAIDPNCKVTCATDQDSMVSLDGVKCTAATSDYEKLVREALTLQVVCMLAGMRMMLPPAKGETNGKASHETEASIPFTH